VELDEGVKLLLVSDFPYLYSRHLFFSVQKFSAKIRKKYKTPKILTYFTANKQPMGTISSGCGKKIDVSAVFQFQFLTQLLSRQREVANGNICLTDGGKYGLQFFFVHRRYGEYLEGTTWETADFIGTQEKMGIGSYLRDGIVG
jgi:hypothetical protein